MSMLKLMSSGFEGQKVGGRDEWASVSGLGSLASVWRDLEDISLVPKLIRKDWGLERKELLIGYT